VSRSTGRPTDRMALPFHCCDPTTGASIWAPGARGSTLRRAAAASVPRPTARQGGSRQLKSSPAVLCSNHRPVVVLCCGRGPATRSGIQHRAVDRLHIFQVRMIAWVLLPAAAQEVKSVSSADPVILPWTSRILISPARLRT